jgi:hypothetical protein
MTERAHIGWVVLGALIAAAWVCVHIDAPLVEDSLFWWVPKGIKAGEAGFPLSPSGDLPLAMTASASALPQWSGGLPDYGHPPLWYWWLGLWTQSGASLLNIRLATLLPAMAAGAGFVALGHRLGSTVAGFAVFALPPFLAQLVRPELDLPLLALVPWALIALLDRAWMRFSVLSALAVFCKEPGVLLVVPALVTAFDERRIRWAALTPLFALGIWAAMHGWMAKPERLPDGLLGWGHDLATVAFIVFIAQGRFLLLLGLKNFRGERALAAFVLVWMAFFATVGFFANRGTADLFTHVRYLLPGMAVAAVVMAGRWPWMALGGLLWLRTASPFGPEASLHGIDVARSGQDAAPWIQTQVDQGQTVWVGSHLAAALTQPWAGMVDRPTHGIRVYSIQTQPEEVRPGSILIASGYGEPTGAILAGRDTELLQRWSHGQGQVEAFRVGPTP